MKPYVWRLQRIGFSMARAYEIGWQYRKEKDLEGLYRYIEGLEKEWGD